MNESSALHTFTQLCEDHGLLSRAAEHQECDSPYGLTDESTLLFVTKFQHINGGTVQAKIWRSRFLRGKSLNIDEALQQFQEALAIRKAVNAVSSYENIDVGEFEETRSLVRMFLS
jgi:hypothetical protein